MPPSIAPAAAIRHAFVALLFARRYDAIRVGDVIAAAGVSRSTFYNHFAGKDDVLLAVIEPVLAPLADAAAGQGDPARLTAVLDHVWAERATGRLIFGRALRPRLQRRLAAMIEARLAPPHAIPPLLAATGLAARQLAMIELWIAGAAPSKSGLLAEALMVSIVQAESA